MSDPNKPGSSGAKVEIIKLANKLKDRMGYQYKDQEEGFLAPETIEEAEKLIAALCINCPKELAQNLDKLTAVWAKMKAMPDSPARSELAKDIFTLSHEIKDIGSMCGYDLIAYFAESLRDYI